ncbi:2Fe-2S iron-sulfur cluster-binding protein [Aliamphritea spongicola]|nr:2Fe-2S iron-sulfur cluster-binding protein [Aliamphritea spongicola]
MPVYNDNRLANGGLLVDRSKTVSFSFDGREFKGFAGDTIASALAANGQWLISRSFKYHRPRGALTMAGQDANTLVQLPSDPNVLADRETIRDGLNVSGQNFTGSLEKTAAAIWACSASSCRWVFTTRPSTSQPAPGKNGHR